jgi:hypothetical protein
MLYSIAPDWKTLKEYRLLLLQRKYFTVRKRRNEHNYRMFGAVTCIFFYALYSFRFNSAYIKLIVSPTITNSM